MFPLGDVGTGHIPVRMTACDLDRSIDEALALVKMTGRQKDILFARTTGNDGMRVHADPEKATWVIKHLLDHAVKNSPYRGIVTLEVSIRDQRVDLCISDQGPGVPAAFRDRLFHHSVAGPGFGEGLSMAREFMEAMGGGIAYAPIQGDGPLFMLTFAATH